MEANGYTLKTSLKNASVYSHLPIKKVEAYIPQMLSKVSHIDEFRTNSFWPDDTSEIDYDDTLYYDANTKIIYININIVRNQIDVAKNFYKNILMNSTSPELETDIGFFSMDEIIDSVIKNPNVKKIVFPTYLSRYTLTKENLEKLMAHGIVAYVPCFEPSLKSRVNKDFFISTHFYDTRGFEHKQANLNSPIPPQDFTYLLKTNQIVINYLDIENFIQIFTFLKSHNYQGEITIRSHEINKSIDLSLLDIFGSTLNITIVDNRFDRSEYKNASNINEYNAIKRKLQNLLLPIKNSDLSPFEKYIYLYNLVKNYKRYKDNDKDDTDSRSIYNILDNKYMVCAGYANLLANLCEMVGIPCAYIECDVGALTYPQSEVEDAITKNFPNFMQNFIKKHKNIYKVVESFVNSHSKNAIYNRSGHARIYVNIVDPKYGIDGYYYSDPTWDSSRDFDYYTHLAFTDAENSRAKTPFYFDYMALFDIKTKEEFWEKLTQLKKYDNYANILRNILTTIIYIDYAYFKSLGRKYGFSENYFLPEEMSEETITNIFDEICTHILTKTNKTIPKETKYEAIKNYLSKTNTMPTPLINYYMHILSFFNDLDTLQYFNNEKNTTR